MDMMRGKRVVIAGSRKLEEFCALVEKQGGIPIVRSMQGTVYFAEDVVGEQLRSLVENGTDWLVLITGVGTETLFSQAEKLGIYDEFLQLVERSKVAARGYKTVAALKKKGIKPLIEDDDGTNRGLIRAMQHIDFSGQRVVVQLHGEPAPGLIRFFEEAGAVVSQLLPYQHIAPEDQVADLLSKEIIDQTVDAVCFTTGLQIHNLFNYAKQNGSGAQLIQAFESNVLAVSIGKLTAESLIEEGVQRIVVPESERSGAMIYTLRDYFASNEAHQ